MSKKITITLILIILSSAFIVLNQTTTSFASASDPSALKIYIGPASVLADNNTYNCIFVQLLDANGKPARALQDTTISLSSSSTNIGTVDPSITILKGTTYASANFNSTFSPGTTTIAAAATGFATVQSTITTIGPIPSAIAVYGFPSTLPADGGSYDAIMVQLQDSSGTPAKAPKQGIQVALSSSNTNVGTVTPSVTILEGQSYAIATFTSSTTPGTAYVTAVAPNYASSQVTITTQNIAASATQLKIYVGPTKVLADNNAYKQIAIQLQDSAGNNANATSDIQVTVASSDETIGTIQSPIIIPQNKTYALATLVTTYKAGTTTITAVATNLLADHESISTFGFIPSKIAVYCVPSILPSDNATYQSIQVQLQDSQGRPAKDPEADVNINLFSSQPTVASVSSAVTIPFGQTQATGNLMVTNAAGSTTITAQAAGYTTGQGTVTTYLIDYSTFQITVTASSQTVSNGNNADLTAYITADGIPITGATVTFTSNNGGTFTTTTDQGNGYYKATFTAPSFSKTTTCTITASASKTGYITAQGTTQISVEPTITPTTNPTATPTPTPTASPTPPPNNKGTIQLCIKDVNDDPLNDTIVSSVTQPAGMSTLFDVTNATGYVKFQNATAGSYTFQIIRQGYEPMNATIDFTGQPLALSITLLNGNTPADNSLLLLVVSIVIVAIVVSAVGVVFVIRRRNTTRIRKLRELQRQLNQKY